jgi:hypothetical protein
MVWMTWRQHRIELIAAVTLFVLVSAGLLISGLSMHAAYRTEGIEGCLADTQRGACGQIITSFRDRYVGWGDTLTLLNLLPALAGVFIGAPLLSRELEHGTWKLVFVQSVTRIRWLTVKIALVGGAVILIASAFAAMLTWWRQPLDAVGGRIDPAAFNFEGLSLAAAALFGFAVGTFIGVVLRRMIAAMAVTLLVYFAIRTPVEQLLRPRYQDPLVRTFDINSPPVDNKDWILGQGWMDSAGRTLSTSEQLAILRGIREESADFDQHMLDNGYRPFIEYQPNGRFWTFQYIEAGLFVALAALFIAAAVLLIRRRTS